MFDCKNLLKETGFWRHLEWRIVALRDDTGGSNTSEPVGGGAGGHYYQEARAVLVPGVMQDLYHRLLYERFCWTSRVLFFCWQAIRVDSTFPLLRPQGFDQDSRL